MASTDEGNKQSAPLDAMNNNMQQLSLNTQLPGLQRGGFASAQSTTRRKPVASQTSSSTPQDSPSSAYQVQLPLGQPLSATLDGTNAMPRRTSGLQRKPVGATSIRRQAEESQGTGQGLGQEDTQEDSASSLERQQSHSRAKSEPFQRTYPSAPSQASNWPLPAESPSQPTPQIHLNSMSGDEPVSEVSEGLQYYHKLPEDAPKKVAQRASHGTIETMRSSNSDSQTASSGGDQSASSQQKPEIRFTQSNGSRPDSAYTPGSDPHSRGRSLTPQEIRMRPSLSPGGLNRRNVSAGSRNSMDNRSSSYVDLLNIPHSQQVAHQNLSQDNARLRNAVGTNASLLDTRKTLEMYRANVKKTNDPAIQYEFALFMVNAALESPPEPLGSKGNSQDDLLKEARTILQKLSDRSYVFAQYYLADGYFSGLFNGGKEDYEKAFPIFLSASKHGHAESSYRTALCYEFGWGCRRDYAKAVQFHRHAASKGHPGAATRLGKACLTGEMGLGGQVREGVRWLKRGQESADGQHNAAPYELGLLHVTGFGDEVFKDESYAAQLFTQSAELGHPQAALRMGQAYEHGLLTCPKDPALSIHFYTGAANGGVAQGMMSLCAWYMVGAEPVLEKDEFEAYEWAKRAAATGYPKAEYALGYFTEMGIGCRRDPLEANVYYVRAADQGDQRAKHRLEIIRAAEAGAIDALAPGGNKALKKKKSAIAGSKDNVDDKDCIVM